MSAAKKGGGGHSGANGSGAATDGKPAEEVGGSHATAKSEPVLPRDLRLGGMALRNGLMIHGPTSWALAVRKPDGTIEVAAERRPIFARGLAAKTPLLRGPLRLAEAMAVLPLARLRVRSARLAFEDWTVVAAMLGGFGANRLLRRMPPSLGREAAMTAVGALPALVSLTNRDLAAYHGVEHKAIGAYEMGSDDPSIAPKEHRRCGSNLVMPMAVLSAVAQAFVAKAFPRPSATHRALGGLLAVGAAVELFAYADRNPDSPLAATVHVPGHEIQRLFSTAEPTPEQLEIGRVALRAILEAEAGRS